jgi:glycerate kinase
MPLHILVVPDKLKGTLTAQAAAQAIACGWTRARPEDSLDLLPMSDGGDGFGEIVSALVGAKPQTIATVNAAHEKITATWWWNAKTKTAVIESAKIIGLAMLPRGKFHPFDLDTFGLGKVLQAAAQHGAQVCLIGIGGSATNDGGFGVAQALGWRFLDENSEEIVAWTGLDKLQQVVQPKKPRLFQKLIVAVDVKNLLLGGNGCSRVYGPQKGMRAEDFPKAERCLKKLAMVVRQQLRSNHAATAGSGAAGGLGFGLLTFAGARSKPGFDIFAKYAHLQKRLRQADVVLTGEGALDEQTLMGKGVGQIALLCRKSQVPCLGFAGVVIDPKKAQRIFTETYALTQITGLESAKKQPAKYIEQLSAAAANAVNGNLFSFSTTSGKSRKMPRIRRQKTPK